MQGYEGWDEYAPFYDWENRRTLGRRDVKFWQSLAKDARAAILELGCGTGRILAPARTAARKRVPVVGIDRSVEMLDRARRRLRRAHVTLVRGDIRSLPFSRRTFDLVMASYGILQSLLRDTDLAAVLDSIARVTAPGGRLGIDLVPDLPRWAEYADRVSHQGRAANGTMVTLRESVEQDRRRGLTTFHEEYTARGGRGRFVQRFSLTFRTLSVPQMIRRVERAGFRIDAVLGDYRGRAWNPRADVWIILATKE
jgi:ubiquinone/menaquinone biosynthesis C-methylase UbiE